MKKIVSALLISSMVLSSVSFAVADASKPVLVKPATSEAPKTLVNIKLNTLKNANDDFSQTFLHTSKTIAPYIFDLKEADFATSKWEKYVSAVYVQTTDTNYYVSLLYADGSMKQAIVTNTQEVERIIGNAKAANEFLRKEASVKPEQRFTANYKTIFQAQWQLVDEKALITAQQINSKNLSSAYAYLPGILVNEYKVYKKGSKYMLMVSVFPTATWSCTVSDSLFDLDAILGNLIEKNNQLLTEIKTN